MTSIIKIRPHHLLCIPRFYQGGYDKKFAKNMKKIVQSIRKNPNQKVKIVVGKKDNLCNSCPHWNKNKCVQTKQIGRWVVNQDKKIAKYLNLKSNSIHKAKDIFNLSMEKINNQKIKQICKGCIYLNGCVEAKINSAFRRDLNKE